MIEDIHKVFLKLVIRFPRVDGNINQHILFQEVLMQLYFSSKGNPFILEALNYIVKSLPRESRIKIHYIKILFKN